MTCQQWHQSSLLATGSTHCRHQRLCWNQGVDCCSKSWLQTCWPEPVLPRGAIGHETTGATSDCNWHITESARHRLVRSRACLVLRRTCAHGTHRGHPAGPLGRYIAAYQACEPLVIKNVSACDLCMSTSTCHDDTNKGSSPHQLRQPTMKIMLACR